MQEKPVLYVDVDGVISLWGFDPDNRPTGAHAVVDGIPHFLSAEAGGHLLDLAGQFDLVWCTGWEEKANEHLPHLLRLKLAELPTLTFGGRARFGSAHWKLDAIAAYAGDRPAAWIDDFIDGECEAWARERAAPTLLIRTDSAVGLCDAHVERLLGWADEVAPAARG